MGMLLHPHDVLSRRMEASEVVHSLSKELSVEPVGRVLLRNHRRELRLAEVLRAQLRVVPAYYQG